jgi:glycosyltransferase involved in cell wall biosynthesis
MLRPNRMPLPVPVPLRPVVSVVLPYFNEKENLTPLLERLRPVLERVTSGAYEIIFVDDASTDGSAELLDQLNGQDGRVKVLHFSRNFGHQAALTAGLAHAAGQAVVCMDSDLQDPPELIESFVERWRAGFEVVYGVRRRRKESLWKRAGYSLFYRSMHLIAEIDVPLDAGDFCLMDRKVAEALSALPEHNRFLRGLRSWIGFRQVSVEYERAARFGGEPKYTLRKLIRLALSGYVGFSSLPLRMSAWLGFFSAFSGFCVGLWAVIARILDMNAPRGWASTLSVILFVGGMQLLVLGVMGEYLGRIYDEVRRRPSFVVRESRGFGTDELTARRQAQVLEPPTRRGPTGLG